MMYSMSASLRVLVAFSIWFASSHGMASVDGECLNVLNGKDLRNFAKVEILGRSQLADPNLESRIKEFQATISSQGNFTTPDQLYDDAFERADKKVPELAERAQLFRSRKIGHVRALSEIEKEIFSYHLKQVSNCYLIEFEAHVLLDQHGKVHVIYVTEGSIGVSRPASVYRLLRSAISRGDRLVIHLHNHPFFPLSLGYGQGAMLFPSGDSESGDVGSYVRLRKEFNLEQAVITNGFDSVVINSAEFAKLAQQQTPSKR